MSTTKLIAVVLFALVNGFATEAMAREYFCRVSGTGDIPFEAAKIRITRKEGNSSSFTLSGTLLLIGPKQEVKTQIMIEGGDHFKNAYVSGALLENPFRGTIFHGVSMHLDHPFSFILNDYSIDCNSREII